MELEQIKAVISGGVSGLGLGTARRLVAAGAGVVLLDIDDDKGQAAVAELGARSHYVNTDVRSEAAVAEAVAAAGDRMDGLNAVINCAGIIGAARTLGRDGPMALDFFENVIRINLIGSFNLIKAAVAAMQHNEPGTDGERGVIINTASVAAWEGQIGQAAYSASKGGIVGMTLPLAREFTRIGVRVVTIAPGVFWTPMIDGLPPEIQESLGQSIPFPKRLGTAEEFADTCCFILTNRYVNGSTIRLDGGVRLQPR